MSTHSMKDYYQTERHAPPAHYRHSQSDLTEWDEHNQSSRRSIPGPAERAAQPPAAADSNTNYAYRNGNANRGEDYGDEMERRRSEIKRTENRFNDSASVISNTVLNHLHGIHRRPVNRNSNLLSATLCLVKELDCPSLEVVEHAVRCRIDELTE